MFYYNRTIEHLNKRARLARSDEAPLPSGQEGHQLDQRAVRAERPRPTGHRKVSERCQGDDLRRVRAAQQIDYVSSLQGPQGGGRDQDQDGGEAPPDLAAPGRPRRKVPWSDRGRAGGARAALSAETDTHPQTARREADLRGAG